MTRRLLAYRHAAYDTPWWAFPSSRHGRFHRATAETVQYWSLHPLGPAAEMLRHNVGPFGDPDDVLVNLWAARLEVDNVVEITFDDCATHAISPDELVGDDYTPTQLLADNLRAGGAAGFIVPSAALPGTGSLALFGARVIHPYLAVPLSLGECPTGHLSDGARPPGEVAPLVRWFGAPHRALEQWKTTGTYVALQDPLASRW